MDVRPLEINERVYTVLRHVSRSGMSRTIDAFVIRDNDLIPVISVLNEKQRKEFLSSFKPDPNRDGFKIGGVGMDMGFHLVYTLSSIVFYNGHSCIGEECPSNDHTNGMPRDMPARERNRVIHSDGGYALKQRWI